MNLSLLRVIGVASLLSFSPVPWNSAAAQTADSGWNIVNSAAGQCLGVAENRPGGQVVLGQCGNFHDRPFQIWTLRGNQYLNVASGLCLDVAEARSGGRVVIDACEAPSQRPFQYWAMRDSGREFNEVTGLCLDAAETFSGWQVTVDECGDDASRPFQRWVSLHLVGPGAPPDAVQASGGMPAPPPPPAASPEGFVWHYQRSVSENAFETRLSVNFGIPETDAYMANLSCLIGNSGPYATMLLGAPVSTLGAGQRVRLSVSGDRGYSEVIDASVYRAEEGIEGVEFAVNLDSRFLAALRDQGAVRYSIPGLPETSLPLDGSSIPMLEFVSDCSIIGDLATSGTMVSAVEDFGCARLGQLRSVDTPQPQFVRFENLSDGYRVVHWIDFEGTLVQYGGLNPGEVMEINTNVTHPWAVTDGPGNCLQVIELTAGVQNYAIVAPNRDFGSE